MYNWCVEESMISIQFTSLLLHGSGECVGFFLVFFCPAAMAHMLHELYGDILHISCYFRLKMNYLYLARLVKACDWTEELFYVVLFLHTFCIMFSHSVS